MLVEIVSTGDELITGSVVDTNASYIASKFYEIGLMVNRCTIVGDNKEKIQKCIGTSI